MYKFNTGWRTVIKKLKSENASERSENAVEQQTVIPPIINEVNQESKKEDSSMTEIMTNFDKCEFLPLPILAPLRKASSTYSLNAYVPLSREYMSYGWRQFRNLSASSILEMIDLTSTIDNSAKQGFYLSPVFKKHRHNSSQLIILLDQKGSMTPFHHLGRALTETALSGFSDKETKVFYFHNLISDYLYTDEFLTQKIELRSTLEECGTNTGILIFSDAGAARGKKSPYRINLTQDFINNVKKYTASVAWLNPMPEERWSDTSARIISELISMSQMDADGFSNVIDVLRGQHSLGK